MLKKLKVLLYASVFTLAATDAALAGPLVAGVGAFFAALGPIGQIVVGLGFQLVGQLVTNLFGPRPQQQQEDRGTSLTMRVGGDGPMRFPLGPSADAGTLVYPGSWGNSGGTPNAYFVQAIAMSDLPISGFAGFWVNDEKATLGTLDATLGYPVLQYRRNGKDHVWIKPYTGIQTTPDAYLRDKFGSHPVYPFTDDMIGRGVAYIVVTTLLPTQDDRDLISQPPRVLAELGSILLYDPRKDSSVGGDGAHRWNNPATWEPSANRIVQAYNVARGIHYGGDWIFGGQNWPAFRLPLSSWIAAMNACDLEVDLKGGGTEPQFHGGGMVSVDMEPAAVIEECLKSASGLIAEVGGVYKVRVGAPGVPVMSFTDDDIIVTKEQGFRPFVGMEDTYNTVNATYTEPGERWARKEAPQLRDGDMIDEDDGRELPIGIDYPTVHSNTTVQRLIQTALRNARRFRTHVHYLPPQAWLLEPLDVVAWTSARNGYAAKDFDIEEIEGGSNFLQMVRLRENEPGDYDRNPEADEQPWSIAPLETIRPAPQPMTGWQVEPATFFDDDANARRPTMEISYAGGLEDVGWVRVQVRLKSTEDVAFEGEVPYDAPYAVKLNGVFIGNTEYQARGKYVPFSTRQTEWSGWLPVTTPDIRISQPDLDDLIRARIQQIAEQVPNDIGLIREQVDDLSASMNSQVATILERMGRINIGVGARYEENRAGVELAMDASATANSAIAQFLVDLFAVTPEGEAEVMFRAIAASLSEGALANVALQVRAGFDGEWATAAMEMAALYNEDLGLHSRLRLIADQIDMKVGDVTLPMASVVVSNAPIGVPIVSGEITPDLTERRQLYHTLLTDDAEFKPPIGASAGSPWVHMIEQDDTGGHVISVDSDIFVGGAPEVASAPGAVTILDGIVWNVAPPRIILTARGSGLGGISLFYLDSYSTTANSTVYSFNNIPIGEARSDRLIVVAIANQQFFGFTDIWGSTANLTINGNPATLIAPIGGDAGDRVALYQMLVTAGTTCDIVLTCSAADGRNVEISVYSILRADSITPYDDAYNSVSASSVSVSLDVAENGIVISAAYPVFGSGNPYWSAGVALDYINNLVLASASASGLSAESGRTVTYARTTGSGPMQLVAASWS